MNVMPLAGGKVHLQASWNTYEAFPRCRTNAQHSRLTRYRKTTSPVTCDKCKPWANA